MYLWLRLTSVKLGLFNDSSVVFTCMRDQQTIAMDMLITWPVTSLDAILTLDIDR